MYTGIIWYFGNLVCIVGAGYNPGNMVILTSRGFNDSVNIPGSTFNHNLAH